MTFRLDRSRRTVFTRSTLASADIRLTVVVCLSVCSSVTSRCSTETGIRMKTTPHDSAGTLIFWCRKHRQNSNGVTLNGGAKRRCGGLNAGAVTKNWRLSTRSVVNLARSQVYHTERPPSLLAARSSPCSASRGCVSDHN